MHFLTAKINKIKYYLPCERAHMASMCVFGEQKGYQSYEIRKITLRTKITHALCENML